MPNVYTRCGNWHNYMFRNFGALHVIAAETLAIQAGSIPRQPLPADARQIDLLDPDIANALPRNTDRKCAIPSYGCPPPPSAVPSRVTGFSDGVTFLARNATGLLHLWRIPAKLAILDLLPDLRSAISD